MATTRLRALAAGAACVLVLSAASPRKDVDSSSPVADAAQADDVETVRALLGEGADVNAARGDGMTALHWAAFHENVALAEMLLYAGANVNASTRLGAYTPLLLASKTGNARMVEMLLDAGAAVDGGRPLGVTPLMEAAASGSTGAVRALIEHGADVDASEVDRRRTPLMFAAAENRHEVVELLTAHGADVSAMTNRVDIGKAEKKWRDAHAKKQEQRRAAAKKKAEEDARARGEAVVAEEETDAAGDGKNVLAKIFGWLPGVGGEKDEPARRRRRRRPYGELVGAHGGLTALHLAARQGSAEAVDALLEAGADIDVASGGDATTPLLIATINGHFNLARSLLERGADPNLASRAGATPLYAAVNLQWAPKALYPQPTSHHQQEISYLELMELLLKAGADPNARLKKKLWYSSYNFDLSGVNESGATAFWRAAYGADVQAMKLLVAYGADPHLPTIVPILEPDGEREPPNKDDDDESGLPPVGEGDPAVSPLLAAAGVGYGEGFAANSHRHHPAGMMRAVRYLIEELGADVSWRDHDGYNALHHAAARGDTEMIQYLVDQGCDVTAVSRRGRTTADMANGPVQRVQPFPEAVALLESLGSKNNHNCVSC